MSVFRFRPFYPGLLTADQASELNRLANWVELLLSMNVSHPLHYQVGIGGVALGINQDDSSGGAIEVKESDDSPSYEDITIVSFNHKSFVVTNPDTNEAKIEQRLVMVSAYASARVIADDDPASESPMFVSLDTDDFHDSGDNAKLTIPFTGIYSIKCQCAWSQITTNSPENETAFQILVARYNSSDVLLQYVGKARNPIKNGDALLAETFLIHTTSQDYYLEEGNYLKVLLLAVDMTATGTLDYLADMEIQVRMVYPYNPPEEFGFAAAPESVDAGGEEEYTIEMRDGEGNLIPGTLIVDITSSDPLATATP